MPINSSLISTRISRRAMLGTAAAMAATPALAEVCPIGPPAHEKGPRVWMDMDQIELDAAYDQTVYRRVIQAERLVLVCERKLRRVFQPSKSRPDNPKSK